MQSNQIGGVNTASPSDINNLIEVTADVQINLLDGTKGTGKW